MLSQTGFARPAAMIGAVAALITSASVVLILAATPSLTGPSPVVPRARAATEQMSPQAMEQMSPQAMEQYRAFYAQQLTSEVALERWSLPEVSARGRATQQRDFYAEQMASEAALERWSSARPNAALPGLPESPQRLTAGVPFK